MRKVISVLAVVALVLAGVPAGAWTIPCDFLTGGGFIITSGFNPTHAPDKANFSIGGSCKPGGDGHGLWGHLEYIDHGSGLNAHWLTITAYINGGDTGTDPKTGQPTGTRLICGTARTNTYGDVNWVAKAKDVGEPGDDDEFEIRMTQPVTGGPQHLVYTTEFDPNHTLGGTGSGGGNIQLHKPNPSITGDFGGPCPAFTDLR